MTAPLTALVYDDGRALDARLRGIAALLKTCGHRLAGFVQHARERAGRTRCDMFLEDLASGAMIEISEDRGAHAKGCILSVDALLQAVAGAEQALSAETDLLIVNKFGKTEAEGGGFRGLVSQALELGVPVLVAVPSRNLAAFRAFAGDLAVEVPVDDWPDDPLAAAAALGLALTDGASATA